jgi:hypothetical protein
MTPVRAQALIERSWLLAFVLSSSAVVSSRARADEWVATESGLDASDAAPLRLELDTVLGRGGIVTLAEGASDASQRELADVDCASFVITGEYAVLESLDLGVRIPLNVVRTHPSSDSRTSVTLSNVEIDIDYEMELTPELSLIAALDLALPTASGEPLPSARTLATRPASDVRRRIRDYDAYASHRIATSVRGHEEDALFEPGYLGFVPVIALQYLRGRLTVRAYLEIENLFGVRSYTTERYIGELDFGASVAWQLSELVELALKTWANAGIVGEDESAAVVEPQLRLRFGHLELVAGAIIPYAGDLVDPQFFGARLAVATRL